MLPRRIFASPRAAAGRPLLPIAAGYAFLLSATAFRAAIIAGVFH
jgi:hypothetical protein